MKPTITKGQAEGIEFWLREYGTDKGRFIEAHANDDREWYGECAPLNHLDTLTLAAALINGYKVEATPEEKVRDYYEHIKRSRDERHVAGDIEAKRHNVGVLTGIRNTLDIFGIKIEGVNA